MMRISDYRLEQLTREVGRCQRLVEQREHEAARLALEQVLAELRRAGLDSALVHWMLAVANDYLGNLEAALEHALVAVGLDPVGQSFRASLDIIAGRIEAVLCDPARPPDADDTPALHALLAKAGRVDAAAHLALAKWHAARGEREEALKLAEAIALLNPDVADAWRMKADILRARGDEEGARRCEERADEDEKLRQNVFAVADA